MAAKFVKLCEVKVAELNVSCKNGNSTFEYYKPPLIVLEATEYRLRNR